ncbi:MAG: response regulator [Chloroflexi bacterium]|nr:response regulator [Chloroflexota bacterium]
MTGSLLRGDILLVDDTPDNLRLLSSFLNEKGFKVRTALNGAMALTAANAARPDLILLDITMPGMSGYEVAERLRQDEHTRETPIIFVSALNETLDKVRAFSSGGVDYIPKPFQFEEVLARVQTHLELSQLRHALHAHNEELEARVSERTAQLETLNQVYARFVPREFLTALHKKSLAELNLGDQVYREMTLMFTDIRDFTSISEAMTPAENMTFLNAYLGIISPIIRTHNGFIDKFLGDGLLALFPSGSQDALRAAVAMQHAVHAYNQSSPYPEIHSGIGLHHGPMMVGIVGEPERMQTTVISDSVNLTSRLEGLTKHYNAHIVISQSAVDQVGEDSMRNYRCIDNVKVKGKQRPIQVYEVFESAEDAPVKAATRAQFEKGLDLYFQRRFAEASVDFSKVLEANPADRAAQIYLQRAARYMVEGVPEDWDGVEVIIG